MLESSVSVYQKPKFPWWLITLHNYGLKTWSTVSKKKKNKQKTHGLCKLQTTENHGDCIRIVSWNDLGILLLFHPQFSSPTRAMNVCWRVIYFHVKAFCYLLGDESSSESSSLNILIHQHSELGVVKKVWSNHDVQIKCGQKSIQK